MVEVLANRRGTTFTKGPYLREGLARAHAALSPGPAADVAHQQGGIGLDELLGLDVPVGKLREQPSEGIDHALPSPEDLRSRDGGDRMPLELGVEAEERLLELVAVERLVREQVRVPEGLEARPRADGYSSLSFSASREFFSLESVFDSIWRTRSRVTPTSEPIASSVIGSSDDSP